MDVRDATEADEAAVVDLVNLGQPEPMTLEAYRRIRANRDPVDLHARRIGVEGDAVVAYLNVERHPLEPVGWTTVTVKVHAAHRRQGVGRRLWHEALDVVEDIGAERVTAGVRDDDPDSRAWAERRGFGLWAHRFQSVLDLEAFDDAAFGDAVERVEADGLRLFTYAEATEPDRAERLRILVNTVSLLTPDNDQGTTFTAHDFASFFLDPAIHPPSGLVIAADGDEWVGATTLSLRTPGFLYTTVSGVLPSHQGRGIALALKVRSVEIARGLGATRMGTNNLSINGPILAVNRKMGYRPQPGIWLLRRPL